MAGNNPKRQHWVPRFYLKKFATVESRSTKHPRVWICSKRDEDDEPMAVGIENVASENFLYSPRRSDGSRDYSVEEKLSNLESLLALRWDDIADDFVNLEEEHLLKRVMAAFIGSLIVRHPDVYQGTKNAHSELASFSRLGKAPAFNSDGLASIHLGNLIHKVHRSEWDDFKAASPDDLRKIFADSIHPGSIQAMEVLLQKRWSIVFTDNPVFATSDRPVVAMHPERKLCGIGVPGAAIQFPLSPKRMLLLDDRHDQPGNRYYPLPGGPSVLNLVTLWGTYRFLITHDDPMPVLRKAVGWGMDEAERLKKLGASRAQVKVGRNGLCSCGSGKKRKKCCF